MPTTEPRPVVAARTFVLAVFSLLSALPLLWLVMGAFSAGGGIGGTSLPWPPYLGNFRQVMAEPQLLRWFANSLVVACLVTAGSVLVNAMAGFAFAHLRFHFREQLFWALLALLMVPNLVIFLPLFILFSDWGWLDTYQVLVVPHLASVWGMFLLRQRMRGIPPSIVDAARLDGATEWAIFTRVVIPIVRPVLAALAVLTFMTEWNSFFWWLVFTSSDSMRNVQVGMATLRFQYADDYGPMLAVAVLAAVPVLGAFAVFRKAIRAGLAPARTDT